ncbi:MAG: acyltransferase [Oscillospiraceae bacterium]|jgi:surface polysaccharide O-acyltransferase-like enzyme|nr:acyltransferase [Oscillospiraceae bacterium]
MNVKARFLPKKSSGGSRILSLELLKVLSAFLVVFYHLAYYKLDYGFAFGAVYSPNANRILMCFAACSVPIFFLVNGYLMFHRKRSWQSVYAKAAKILVLMLVWHWLGFPSWFFRTLVILYLLFPLFQYCLEKKPALYLLGCIAVFLMPFVYNFALLFLKRAGVESLGPLSIANLNPTGAFTMYGALYFLLGPLLAKWKNVPVWACIVSILAGWALVVFEGVSYTNLNGSMYDAVNSAFPTIGALLLATGLFLLLSKGSYTRASRPLMFLGGSVMPVYLMHMVFINLFQRIFGYGELSLPTSVLLSAVVFAHCALYGKLFEKTPVLCWFIRI